MHERKASYVSAGQPAPVQYLSRTKHVRNVAGRNDHKKRRSTSEISEGISRRLFASYWACFGVISTKDKGWGNLEKEKKKQVAENQVEGRDYSLKKG